MNVAQKLISTIAARFGLTTSTTGQITNLYDRNLFQFIGDGQPLAKPDEFDYILYGYEAVGAVYECVTLITNKLLEADLLQYQVIDGEAYKAYKKVQKSNDPLDRIKAKVLKTSALKEVSVPQISNLIQSPNNKQSYIDFIEMLVLLYLLDGNAYIYGNAGSDKEIQAQKWTELFALPDMHIVSGGVLDPVKAYYLFWQRNNEQLFPANQIKHIKTANPRYSLTGQQLYGLPPLKAYRYQMDYIKNANIQADKQAYNGATFGVIAPKNKEDQWSKDQKDDFKERLLKGYLSDGPLSRWFPSSVALDYLQIGLSIADLELNTTSTIKAEDIYRCFHVPLFKRSTEASALNNLKESGKQFIYDAVWPVANKIECGLTEFICQPYKKSDGKVYILEYDIPSLPELAVDQKELAEWLDTAWWITPNLKLEAQGYSRSAQPGMDEIYIPKTLIRLQDVVDGKFNPVTNTLNDPAVTGA